MACEIEKMVEEILSNGTVTAKALQKAIDANKDTALGSDEFSNNPNLLEDEHRAAEALNKRDNARKRPRALSVSEVYENLKADVKYEGNNNLYHQTVSDIDVTPDSIYVTIGKNRFKFSRNKTDLYALGRNTDKDAKLQVLYVDINPIREYANRLGSDENKADPRIDAKNLRKNGLTKQGMKDIVNELYAGNDGYRKYALGLIDLIDDSFIPKMKLYINKEAERNSGIVTAERDIIIDIAPNMDKSDKSPTEVYMHEIIHAITKFALDSMNPDMHPLRVQLAKLRDEAAKLFTYKDFMPEQYLDKTEAKKAAEARYDYIFNQANSLHEFAAYGMTNPKVMNKLRANKSKQAQKKARTLFQWLFDIVSSILDKVLGTMKVENSSSMKTNLQQLVFEMMKYNNEAVRKVEEVRTENAAVKALEKGNKVVSEFLRKVRKSLEGEGGKVPKPPKNGTALQNTLYTLKWLPQLMLRDDLKGYRNAILGAFFMKPEGFVQNTLRDIEEPSELERLLEQAISDAGTIDRMRELLVDVVEEEIHNSFTRRLTKVEEEAITLSAIDTDLSVIYDKYSRKEIADILTDDAAREQKIKEVTTALRKLDGKNFNWNKNQAHGLGYYMATGKAGYAQNLNAYNIASGIQSGYRRKPNKAVIAKIDELATLTAIKYTPEASNAILRNLIVEQKAGIDKVIELYKVSKTEARDKVFNTPVNMIKGYSKELFDDTIDVKIKPVAAKDAMEREGYQLVEILNKDKKDTTAEPMAIYRSKLYVNNSYNRMATRMTDLNKRGTSIKDITYISEEPVSKAVVKKRMDAIRAAAAKEAEDMTKDGYEMPADHHMIAVLNEDGQVVDYRYMMGKRTKQELLGQDTRITKVLGRTIASINDKADTDVHNKMILEIILADMKDNYEDGMVYGKNKEQYIKIEKNSPNKDVQEIYKLLPNNMKQAIEESDYKYIAVRRDMLHNYFGFRDKSIVDFFGLHHITPDVIQKWVRFIEKLWMEIVAVSKVDIVIRTPMVFIGNVISNIMYSIVNNKGGVFNLVGVMRIAKMQIRNVKATMDYVKTQREIEHLKLRAAGGDESAEKRIAMLEAEQTKNPVSPLMEAGMYQAIIDDLKKQEYKPHGKFAKRLEGVTDNIPEFIKTGASWLYLDANTSYFKLMTTATQMSDFAARATEYQLLKERGVSEKEAKDTVLDAFVNYSKPASAFEEYLNNIGLFMFTKYAKRVQRAIAKTGKTKPINVILSILAQEAFFDVDDIQEQHVVSRSWNNYDQDMFDHIMKAITPTGLQFAGIVK